MARSTVTGQGLLTRSASLINASDPRPLTIRIKFKAASRLQLHWLFTNNYNSGDPRCSAIIDSDGTSDYMRVYSGGYATRSTAFTLSTSAWTDLVWTWDASNNLAYFLNGAANGTTTQAIAGTGSTDGAALCALNANSQVDGSIAEFAVWSVILSAAEIAALALDLSPILIRPASLVCYVPILGQAAPEQDLFTANTWSTPGTIPAVAHPRVVLAYSPPAIARTLTLFHIAGVTKSSTGTALASCTVKLYRTSDDVLIATTTSDGSGNYSFPIGNTSTQFYLVAYKAGSPDVAGTSVNTIVGA